MIRRVVGDSMLPTLEQGKIVVGLRLPIKKGAVVIAEYKGREVIKRVTEISMEGVSLQGDNAVVSKDSRTYGQLPRTDIQTTVVWPFGLYREL